MDADLAAGGDAAVDAHAGKFRRLPQRDPSRRRQEVVGRVLGVETRLDGVSVQGQLLLGERQGLALGQLNLPAHQVEAGHRLGHRVLHLQARVHLEKVEVARGVDEELDGAGAHVADGLAGGDGGGAHLAPQAVVDGRRRRLLDDLLEAPLDRALALEAVQQLAPGVAEDLDLDVAGGVEVALEQQRVVAEGRGGLAARGGEGLGEVRLGSNHPHALSPAARAGLDEDGVADLPGLGGQLRVGLALAGDTGDHRHAGGRQDGLRLQLVAHLSNRLRGGADEREARLVAALREIRVLGEEAVARMDRIGAHRARRLQDAVDGEIRLCARRGPDVHGLVGFGDVRRARIGVRVDGDARDPHLAHAAQHALGDLAAVGDQDFFEASRHVVLTASHPEHAPARRPLDDVRVHRRERDAEHAARVAWVDDAVVPDPRGGEERVRLPVDLVLDGLSDLRIGLLVEGLARALGRRAAHDREHARELLGAHHRDAMVGPAEEQARIVGATRHAVVARSIRRADHDREVRHAAVRDRVDELRAVLDDPALFVAPAHHEARDVLQEEDRRVGLVAELDELGALLGGLGEQDAVVGEDADRVAVDVGVAGDQGGAVAWA